ncbi:MAG: hypothetical protein ACRC6C_03295 [Wolbachia pipientis]
MRSFFLSYFRQKVNYHSSGYKIFAQGALFCHPRNPGVSSQCRSTLSQSVMVWDHTPNQIKIKEGELVVTVGDNDFVLPGIYVG